RLLLLQKLQIQEVCNSTLWETAKLLEFVVFAGLLLLQKLQIQVVVVWLSPKGCCYKLLEFVVFAVIRVLQKLQIQEVCNS
ncbi:hypothetical protein PSY83_23985, partial [Shigella flexneri]|nr:hypothetical protein [Shigella flexneri]